jgi:hypothetical protein
MQALRRLFNSGQPGWSTTHLQDAFSQYLCWITPGIGAIE